MEPNVCFSYGGNYSVRGGYNAVRLFEPVFFQAIPQGITGQAQ